MDHHALLRSLRVNLPGRPVSVVSAFQGSKATPRSLPLRHLFSHTAPKGHCVRIGEGTWVYCPLTFCSTSAARGDRPLSSVRSGVPTDTADPRRVSFPPWMYVLVSGVGLWRRGEGVQEREPARARAGPQARCSPCRPRTLRRRPPRRSRAAAAGCSEGCDPGATAGAARLPPPALGRAAAGVTPPPSSPPPRGPPAGEAARAAE